MVTTPHAAAASLPPSGLAGLDPSWSRLVHVPATDGVGRTWHLLDNAVVDADLTVLCVHGNPSWSYLYRNLVRLAPEHVRVIAVDQLEMGFSERSGGVRRLAKRVDDLCELTDEMGITGPVVTVAHDWGGPISLGWAQRHLDHLVGVVLMNTAVHQPAGSPAPGLIRLTRSRPMLKNVTVRTTSFIRGALEMSDRRPNADVRRGFLAPYLTADRRAAIAEFVADIPLDSDHPSASTLDRIASDLDLLHDVPDTVAVGGQGQGLLRPLLARPRTATPERRRPPLSERRSLRVRGRRCRRSDRRLARNARSTRGATVTERPPLFVGRHARRARRQTRSCRHDGRRRQCHVRRVC